MIMDGNRRWAKARGLPKTAGHKHGAEKLKDVLKWCKDINANSLTVYAFSTENFNRTQEELEVLYKLIIQFVSEFTKKAKKEDVKVNILGQLEKFPAEVQKACSKAIEETQNNSAYTFQICLGYGGRSEITDAVKAIVSEGTLAKDITEETISKHLYTNIEPDLVIRTGGAVRQSNFLMWQSTYSEWFYPDEFWPEFSKETFTTILNEYKERERRFGK